VNFHFIWFTTFVYIRIQKAHINVYCLICGCNMAKRNGARNFEYFTNVVVLVGEQFSQTNVLPTCVTIVFLWLLLNFG
jgi:hypothetical protein